MAGIFAHRALAVHIRGLGEGWHPEEFLKWWKLDISMRPDVYYMKNGVNAVWELKPISQAGDSYMSLKGRHQAQGYADFLGMLKHTKFYTASSMGAPAPIANGQLLTDIHSVIRFQEDQME